MEIPQYLIDRFWSKVDKSSGHGPNGDCWVWTAGRKSLKSGGYGTMGWPPYTSVQAAHRIAWLLHYGEWPTPCALHRCDNPICVRVEHLFEGTQVDNIKDMQAKGRHAHGPTHASGKRTHCPRGHEYSGDNLVIYSGGSKCDAVRICRICKNAHQREYTAKKRLALLVS